MIDAILEEIKRVAKSRLFPVSILFSFLFVVLVYRIFNLEIVNGDEYKASTETEQEKRIETKATRGNIYDRNGVLLAYNELSYSLQIDDNGDLGTNAEKNEMLYKLIHYVEDNGGKIQYDFPMEFTEQGKIQFTVKDNALLKFKMNVYSRNNIRELSDEEVKADASAVYEKLRTKLFDIDSKYSDEDTLKIMSIRYDLYINRYAKRFDNYIPTTYSTNLPEKVVVALKENRAELPGVVVVEEAKRVYKDSEYYAHILGYTGAVTLDNIKKMEEEGNDYYSVTDQIGKTGLEQRYEEELRGKKGYQNVIKTSSGKIAKVLDTVEPEVGNDLYLTIDSKLQKASYNLLEKELASVLLDTIVNSKSYGTKGKSADGITIPIYDVYFALIDNNVINIEHFAKKDATDLEKRTYEKFLEKQKQTFDSLKRQLSYHNKINVSTLSDEMDSYMQQIYTSLKNHDVLETSEIDREDSVYKDYVDGKVGLNSFLVHALEERWINLDELKVGGKYYSTDELYKKLLNYTFKLLQNDKDFSKLIYYNMINNYELSGTDVCLLLYDQKVLKQDENSIQALKSGAISAYSFIREKIKKLEITPAQLALEPCSGSVVITDPNTGDTLACVSYPSFDNNKLANTVDSEYYASLLSDKSSPFVNRASKQRIAPGSTFKTFSSFVALGEGVVTPSTKIYDKVEFTQIGKPFPHCWSKYSHGSIDVAEAIGVSCNYFFYQCGFDLSRDSRGNYVSNLGLKKIQKYAHDYGLTDVSGLELSEDPPEISGEDSVRAMIGQGSNLFAPVQLSRWVTTIANEGTCYNLTLIDKMKDANGKTVQKNKAEVHKKVNIHSSFWNAVKSGMNLVVNGPSSSIDELFEDIDETVAGKTGTSQITTSIPSNGLFISFAPYKKPEITVTVVIPNGYSSSNAAEAASKIYDYYFTKDKKKTKKSVKSKVENSNVDSNSVTD